MTSSATDCRYIVESGAYAVNRRDYAQIGRIHSISRSGLSFDCISGDARTTAGEFELDMGEFELDVTVRRGEFYLQRIPCRTVSFCRPPDTPCLATLPLCRHEVRFLGLSSHQRLQIDIFIQKYTRAADGALPAASE